VRANELLLWLSARSEGSWQQFRAAVEELYFADDDSYPGGVGTNEGGFPLQQQLRLDFECLSHAEFFERDSRYYWRVAPPTLAAHPVAEGVRMILCGARSPALRERVLRAGQRLGCEVIDAHGVPDVIRILAPELSLLSDAASQAGIYLQPDAPLAILSHLPRCDPPSRQHPQSEFPQGRDWRIRQFDPDRLNWLTIDRRDAQAAGTGVFEFQLYDSWWYFFRWKRKTFELPRAIALYLLLRRYPGVLRYNALLRKLSLPSSCRPPRLLERALVLCSGFPPVFDPATRNLTYIDVPPEIARLAAELLRQPLT